MTDLQAAAAAWCDQRRVKLLRTPGQADTWWYAGQAHDDPPAGAAGEWATIPPLLDQLRAAVVPSGESGKGGRGGTGGGPDWTSVDLLDRLRVTLADWRDRAGLDAGSRTLVQQVRQVCAHDWPDLEAGQMARVLLNLAREAQGHLTPPDATPTRYVRATACPDCGERTVPVVNEHGDPAQQPAVIVVLNRGLVRYAQCQACGVQWGRDQLAGWAGMPA